MLNWPTNWTWCPDPLVVEGESLLDSVVAGIGGQPREGQQEMVAAITEAIAEQRHLLVQAGTGTGKSIGYLVPAIAHVRAGGGPVVIATATLALQHQLVSRDLPALDAALLASGQEPISWAVLKGRANYLCRQRIADTVEPPDQVLLDLPGVGRLEADAARVREWAEETRTGDRDEVGEVDPRVWRAFSVTARECMGATKCPFGQECFAELARARASQADVVITNHALLALHAVDNVPVLPEHDVVVVDEAHELAERTTTAMTAELSPAAASRAFSAARGLVSRDSADLVEKALSDLGQALFDTEGRLRTLPEALRAALAGVRDASHAALTELGARGDSDPDQVARVQRAKAMLDDLHDTAGEALAASEHVVVWVDRGGGRQPTLRLAPLSVALALREGLLADRTAVLTSATLTLAGEFTPIAREVGLDPAGQGDQWHAVDVGSPFTFAEQGILYVASDLPRPGRDGPSAEALERLEVLVRAAGGRTLALYSSWRGVEAAAERLTEADIDGVTVLVQQRGDAVGPLVARFASDPTSVLVGTMSLWQGVDVSGAACQLVVIDRIPFPRPDEPLLQARTERVEAAGGSGFAAVSVPRAALMLAQGAGRLIRSTSDRGVVAVLDPRLMTAGYGKTLRASMPPLWLTTSTDVVLGALDRLHHAAVTQTGSDGVGGRAEAPQVDPDQ